MVERFYEFADVVWRVCTPEGLPFQESGVLSPFAVNIGKEPAHTLEFEPVDRLSPPEGEQVYCASDKRLFSDGTVWVRYQGSTRDSLDTAFMRVRREGEYSHIQVKKAQLSDGLTTKMVLNAMEAEHFIVQNRGFILHAAYIRWKDGAVLFTAPSGTGKSTQADLWCTYRGAELINGDRAVVRLDGDRVLACGLPFSGSSGVGKNVTLPLRAIVYLSQSADTSVQKLQGFRAFRRVWEGCSVNIWNRDDVAKCTQTVLDALERIPVYHLFCTPDEAAVSALENVL